jgi:hypothetical protein
VQREVPRGANNSRTGESDITPGTSLLRSSSCCASCERYTASDRASEALSMISGSSSPAKHSSRSELERGGGLWVYGGGSGCNSGGEGGGG